MDTLTLSFTVLSTVLYVCKQQIFIDKPKSLRNKFNLAQPKNRKPEYHNY
jgi:hypothetical protein